MVISSEYSVSSVQWRRQGACGKGQLKIFDMGLNGTDVLPNNRKMQDCFRQHPDIYGSELDEADDEDDLAPIDDAGAPSPSPAPAPPLDPAEGSIPAAATSARPESQPLPSSSPDPPASSDTERARAAKKQVERDHGDAADESHKMVPKAAHDAAGAAITGK